ncbi:MAG: hypothetical protein NXH75_09555 [Halobacteriovoraceae bacterium]|nr:hypothetical protein [Halobacteriovoraceae bacterium]
MAGYKRSIYLVNPKFQLKFSLYVCGLVFISSIIYPLTIFDLITKFIQFIGSVKPEAVDQLEQKRSNLIWILTLWQIGFSALVFIACIFFSHKIAGPMFKLQKFLQAKKDGVNNGKLFFRKGDYFQEVADDFNDVFEEMEERHHQDLMYISEVNSYISNLGMVVPEDKKAVLNEITQKLSLIQKRFDQE